MVDFDTASARVPVSFFNFFGWHAKLDGPDVLSRLT
jgi:hypothetical protein